MADKVDDLLAALEDARAPEGDAVMTIDPKDFVSTGSTALNLAITGHPDRGIAAGTYVLLAGDSDTGKSWVAKSILAEAARRKRFAGHRLIYDDVEFGSLVDTEEFFGRKLAARLEEKNTRYVEDLYDEVRADIKSGTPFIRVVDSMDSLDSRKDEEHRAKAKKAKAKGEEAGGTYGTAKAKANQELRTIATQQLRENDSILVIIAQLKQNIGFGAMLQPKTRAGGTALKFYAHLEVWLNPKAPIKKKVRDKRVEVGIVTSAKVKKNRYTGRKRSTLFTILHQHGIDDTGDMVRFLVGQGHWPKKGGNVFAKEMDVTLTEEKLIRHIEAEELEDAVKDAVHAVWNDIENQSRLERKKRYD